MPRDWQPKQCFDVDVSRAHTHFELDTGDYPRISNMDQRPEQIKIGCLYKIRDTLAGYRLLGGQTRNPVQSRTHAAHAARERALEVRAAFQENMHTSSRFKV